MKKAPNEEIGEELLASQLEPRTVVVLIGTHRPQHAMTSWVVAVDAEAVLFYSGTLRINLALRVNDKGHMFDVQNHRIAVHRYLGEIEEPSPGVTRLVVRGFKSGKLLWEENLVFADAQMERIIPTLAEEHSAACAAGDLGMIEIEFLNEPDPMTRFFRMGVEAGGMVMPVRVDLGKEPTQ